MSARIKYGVSITSKRKILKGTVITQDDITVKCPGGGISPVEYWNLVGKKASKNILADKTIYDGDVV